MYWRCVLSLLCIGYHILHCIAKATLETNRCFDYYSLVIYVRLCSWGFTFGVLLSELQFTFLSIPGSCMSYRRRIICCSREGLYASMRLYVAGICGWHRVWMTTNCRWSDLLCGLDDETLVWSRETFLLHALSVPSGDWWVKTQLGMWPVHIW